MERKPLVSIITPFWNAEKFFSEAIESVLIQTYESWELLLVDDGSADASTAIAQEYATQHPDKIRYLEHPGHRNLGKSSSRNLGIRHAVGEYIAFLDADDVYLPQKLERQVAILEAQPQAGMVYGPTHYWYSWSGNSEDARHDTITKLGIAPRTLYHPPKLLTHFLRHSGDVPCTCGLLTRRSLVNAIGGFDERIQHLYEDQVFLAKVCLEAAVYVDDGCWDRYRRHPDSSWYIASQAGHERATRLIFLQWLESYLSEQGVEDPGIRRALRRQFWPYEHPYLANIVRVARRIARPAKQLVQNFTNRDRLMERGTIP